MQPVRNFSNTEERRLYKKANISTFRFQCYNIPDFDILILCKGIFCPRLNRKTHFKTSLKFAEIHVSKQFTMKKGKKNNENTHKTQNGYSRKTTNFVVPREIHFSQKIRTANDDYPSTEPRYL